MKVRLWYTSQATQALFFKTPFFLTKIADSIGKHTPDKINDMSSMKVNLQIELLQEQVLFE